MNIQFVPLTAVHLVWDAVAPFIESALEHSKGEYTLEQAKVPLTNGDWSLLVAVDGDQKIQGAAALRFFNRPNDRVALIVAIGGRLVSSPDTFEQLKTFCVSNGATAIEGAARESVARLWTRYGFEEKYRIVGVKL